MAVGTLLLAWWLFAAASGPEAFDTVQAAIGSWIGRLLLFGWTFSLFFHLCNGIRHLFWDMGRGFELPAATGSSWLVAIASLTLTAVAWIWGYVSMGAF